MWRRIGAALSAIALLCTLLAILPAGLPWVFPHTAAVDRLQSSVESALELRVSDASFFEWHCNLLLRLLAASSGGLAVYAFSRASAPQEGAASAHGSALWGDPRHMAGIATLPASKQPQKSPWKAMRDTGGSPTGAFLIGHSLTAAKGTTVSNVLLVPELTRQHGVIFGGTGTGKTRGYFMPNASLQTAMSLLCTDPKSELWRYTAGKHRCPIRYAPTEPEASHAFNWVPLCRDARYAELCARTLIEAGEQRARPAEAVWIESETSFLAALLAHAATLPDPTPLTAYQLFTRQEQPALLDQLKASASPVAQEQFYVFQQTQERMRGSIVPAVAAKLQFLRDERIARFTSASLQPPDFQSLRYTPQALFWCLPEQDIVRLRPLTSLFFTLALDQIARATLPDDLAAVPILALLDEFANIGTLPSFPTTIALARSRGLSLWLGVQSLSQLEDNYGRAGARTILANCGTKIALAGLDYDSAEYVSRVLGQGTLTLQQQSWSLRSWLGRTTSVSLRPALSARPLLTPDEVRRLDRDEALVVSFNQLPLLLGKFWYDDQPESANAPSLGKARARAFQLTELRGSTGTNLDSSHAQERSGSGRSEKSASGPRSALSARWSVRSKRSPVSRIHQASEPVAMGRRASEAVIPPMLEPEMESTVESTLETVRESVTPELLKSALPAQPRQMAYPEPPAFPAGLLPKRKASTRTDSAGYMGKAPKDPSHEASGITYASSSDDGRSSSSVNRLPNVSPTTASTVSPNGEAHTRPFRANGAPANRRRHRGHTRPRPR